MVFTSAIAFALAVLAAPLLIPLLRRLKFGQHIRIDGPKRHLRKAGTPTMGGLIILLAFSLAYLRFAEMTMTSLVLLVACFGFGLIGFLDDYMKVAFQRSLGLTARQKLIGQFGVAIVVCVLLAVDGHATTLAIPATDIVWQLGWGYYVLMAIVMVGMTNAVNFTDGLDGLLAGTSSIAFAALAVLALIGSHHEAGFFAASMVGALLGFLVYNAHPAKVFMGDTGSLSIGGGFVAVAMVTKEELLFLLIGAVFIVEMLSVMIQVYSFRTRGKRVFRMSPLHHHWELVGWSEWRVVLTFWFAGVVCAALAIGLKEGLS
jgi:phospho-N-acetylmuramoyl-pentapeptide-transferase